MGTQDMGVHHALFVATVSTLVSMAYNEKRAPNRAAIYARISLDRKEEAGVTRQLEESRKLAELKGFEVVAEHVDNSISAFSGVERPGYTALIKSIERGEIDSVIVWHSDRLHRRTRELIDYFDLCSDKCVVTHAVQGSGLDPTAGEGKLIATIMSAVAEQESVHKGARVRAAHRQSAYRGIPRRGGLRCFGYLDDGVTVVEDEAEWLRKAADHVLAGGSLRSFSKKMNAAGVLTSRGNPMTPASLRDTLNTPRIAGLAAWTEPGPNGKRDMKARQVVGKGQWPAIITEEQWFAIQDILNNPDRLTNKRGNRPQWLGSGIYLCGVCGSPMYSRKRGMRDGTKARQYYCKHAGDLTPEGKRRQHVTRLGEPVDEYITEVVLQRLEQGDVLTALAMAVGENDRDVVAELTGERDRLRGRINDIEARISTEKNDRAVNALFRSLSNVAEQLEGIESRLTDLAGATDSPLTPFVDAPDIRTAWSDADIEGRRRVVDALVKVTLLKAGPGLKGFHPELIDVVPKGAGRG